MEKIIIVKFQIPKEDFTQFGFDMFGFTKQMGIKQITEKLMEGDFIDEKITPNKKFIEFEYSLNIIK